MPAELFTWASLVSLLTLTVLEIVLSIDNIIFISIVASRLDPKLQVRARTIGLGLALMIRIGLLFAISWVLSLDKGITVIGGEPLTIRDVILIAGGLFLLIKSTTEIHTKLEGDEEHGVKGKYTTMTSALFQIVLIDVVFSFDSILTAIGIADFIQIMILSVMISMVVTLIFASPVSNFVNRHPTVKMLALSFLLMIGILLISEGLLPHDRGIPKGYVYFAMAFSFLVEMLNLRLRKAKSQPVKLRKDSIPVEATDTKTP